eukprot:9332826-Heterocapsa_arctica.AAC.1
MAEKDKVPLWKHRPYVLASHGQTVPRSSRYLFEVTPVALSAYRVVVPRCSLARTAQPYPPVLCHAFAHALTSTARACFYHI